MNTQLQLLTKVVIVTLKMKSLKDWIQLKLLAKVVIEANQIESTKQY